MAAPTNTLDSSTDLNIGSVPQVDDPELYRSLLDIHNALEILLTASDDADAMFLEFITKFRKNIEVSSDYTVLIIDGTVLVDASGGGITITLPPISDIEGYRFNIKRIDTSPLNSVVLNGDGTELIDSHASGIKVSTLSSYTVKADNEGWNII